MYTDELNKAPNFIVAGAIKAGTSTLYHCLSQHPKVFMPHRKELRYFAYDVRNDWCISNSRAFPIKSFDKYLDEFAGVESHIAIGEASPNYMASAFAADAIYSKLPSIKLIFSLRNPIDCVYSAYQMDVREGRELRPLELALATTERRVERYKYAYHLKHWYELFDKEQILVISFEDLIGDTDATMQKVFAFLDVDTSFRPNMQNVATNKGGLPSGKLATQLHRATIVMRRVEALRKLKLYLPNFMYSAFRTMRDSSLEKVPPMPDKLRHNLCDYYRSDVQSLVTLTNLDVEKWGVI